jgi:hypothetical protein
VAAAGLDKAETIQPGHGDLSAWLGVGPSGPVAGADLEARLTRRTSAFASAHAAWDLGDRELDWSATGGARFRW